MSKFSRYTFQNPYLEEDEGRITAIEVMDEARERWRADNYRAKREAFEIDRKRLAGISDDEDIPEALKGGAVKKQDNVPASRFRLDIEKDLMGDTISLKKLRELDYSPTYRPKGNLEEHLVTPMSTLQRYDVLAGDLEAPPEDMSFLSDAERRRSLLERRGEKRKDGKLKNNTQRLEKPVDERRSQLMRLLPSTEKEEAKRIVSESKERQRRMDAEVGRVPKEERLWRQGRPTKIRLGKKAFSESEEQELRNLSVVRSTRLPKQSGMNVTREDDRHIPEMESLTRSWSSIDDFDPPPSEVLKNTQSYVPADMEDEDTAHEAHYIDEVDYDPKKPFLPVDGYEPRERLRSNEAGQFKNEYLEKQGINPDRIREILAKKYHGRWIPPEYFEDDQLVNDWFNDLNNGALSGEDFVEWAYRQKCMAEEARYRQELARRQAQRYQENSRRQRQMMQSRQREEYDRYQYEQERLREEEVRRYEDAHRMGYYEGMEMAEREYELSRMEEKRRRRAGLRGYHGMYPELFERAGATGGGYYPRGSTYEGRPGDYIDDGEYRPRRRARRPN